MIRNGKGRGGIIDRFRPDDWQYLISNLRELLETGFDKSQKTIFLCGKSKDDSDGFRFKVSKILETEKNVDLAYPEDLFEDLLEGQGKNSLQRLEESLASAVDLIVLIPESPGSFAELGAFSSDRLLANKMVVLRLNKFKSDKSFINHGPIRLVREHGGTIAEIPNDFDITNLSHVEQVLQPIRDKLKKRSKKKEFDNILLYSKYILIIIYLIEGVDFKDVCKMMEKIMHRPFKENDNIACKAAIHSLIRNGSLYKQDDVYVITKVGYRNVIEMLYSRSLLNVLRVHVLNKQLCK
ncbi:retron St85 family effector protein [Plesiomonas shigelloides]|uniref:retron St85 family effector protein n=1 Tax=Plesiomonas shigelloides TaxID=703 RepID=UPI00387EF598